MASRSVIVLTLALAASPVCAQEREWTIDSTQEDAFLLFGTPGTDDVGASFWCKIGGNKVKLFVSDAAVSGHLKPRKHTMTLVLNDHVFTLPVQLTPQGGGDRFSAESTISLQGKVLDELARTSQFTVTISNHVTSFPFDDTNVSAFRKVCRG
jgi:hypothetical protein